MDIDDLEDALRAAILRKHEAEQEFERAYAAAVEWYDRDDTI